ncbi:MAG TPA: protein kinase, partial [Planctomycetota bacterium]|nr:protein kinase [Planctomycetota bacterium]
MRVPERIGDYRVLDVLGEGGMGVVYLAEQDNPRRRVALKVLHPGIASPSRIQRFRHEAQILGRLHHPGIAQVYEAGAEDTGAGPQPYLALELVLGRTIVEHAAAGGLGVRERLDLLVQVCRAAQHAHERGVIHRDLKPANVMVGVDGHVKVMDFGIAARIGGVEQTTRMAIDATQAGMIVGTIAYSAPEQLLALPPDARSDIFSFGVLLYEMVAGTHPFDRPSMAAMVDAILNAPTPPLRATSSGVTARLERVALRCLEKDRERRFASFREIRAALQSDDAASAVVERVRARPSRRLMAAVLTLTLVAGAAAIARFGPDWLHLSEPALAFNARDWILVTDCDNLTGEPVFDRSLAIALDVGISQSNYVNVYSRDRMRATLQRMRKPATSPVDLALASEIAQRDNVRAVVTCGISKVGASYSLAARVVDPRTQGIALSESVLATSRDGVLAALDQLASRLRGRLGESMATLSGGNRPLPQATTSSLEALKMFAQAQGLSGADEAAGQQLLIHALELDPDFAMAHAVLGYR